MALYEAFRASDSLLGRCRPAPFPNAMLLRHPSPTPGGVPAPYHPREFERLSSLLDLKLSETEGDPLFDEIARRAAGLFDAAAGAVTLVREHDEAFVGNCGMPHDEAAREDSICAYTILSPGPLVVEDLRADVRFAGMSHVREVPGFRFYAGAPVFDPAGLPLGTVCVLDRDVRSATPGSLSALRDLADRAAVLLETRRFLADLLRPDPQAFALHHALDRIGTILAPLFEAPPLRVAA